MKTIQKFVFLIIVLFATNSQAGRWLTRDPIEHMERDPQPVALDSQQQINLYAYVGNNPVSRIDPLGLYWLVSETPFPGQEGQYGPYAAWVPGGGDRVYYWDPNFYNDGPIQPDPWGEMLLPGGGLLMAPAKGFTVCAAKGTTKIGNAANAVEDFLGGQGKIIKNADGDAILMKGDKKIRFDVNDPHGDAPHFHLEQQSPGGKWKDAGTEHRYYFEE